MHIHMVSLLLLCINAGSLMIMHKGFQDAAKEFETHEENAKAIVWLGCTQGLDILIDQVVLKARNTLHAWFMLAYWIAFRTMDGI